MAHVSVPRDLTKVKTKIAMGLTKRQLICFSIATVIGLDVQKSTIATTNQATISGYTLNTIYERDSGMVSLALGYIALFVPRTDITPQNDRFVWVEFHNFTIEGDRATNYILVSPERIEMELDRAQLPGLVTIENRDSRLRIGSELYFSHDIPFFSPSMWERVWYVGGVDEEHIVARGIGGSNAMTLDVLHQYVDERVYLKLISNNDRYEIWAVNPTDYVPYTIIVDINQGEFGDIMGNDDVFMNNHSDRGALRRQTYSASHGKSIDVEFQLYGLNNGRNSIYFDNTGITNTLNSETAVRGNANYLVNPGDAVDGVISIYATFVHRGINIANGSNFNNTTCRTTQSRTVTVTNIGNAPTNAMTVSVSGNAGVSTNRIESIPIGGSDTLTVTTNLLDANAPGATSESTAGRRNENVIVTITNANIIATTANYSYHIDHIFPAWAEQGAIGTASNCQRHCTSCNQLQHPAHAQPIWTSAHATNENATDNGVCGRSECSRCTRPNTFSRNHVWSQWSSWGQGDATHHHRQRTCSNAGCNQNQNHINHIDGRAPHNENATGVWQQHDATSHIRTRSCSTCERHMRNETQAHRFMSWSNWLTRGAHDHSRARTCSDCGFEDIQIQPHNTDTRLGHGVSWRPGMLELCTITFCTDECGYVISTTTHVGAGPRSSTPMFCFQWCSVNGCTRGTNLVFHDPDVTCQHCQRTYTIDQIYYDGCMWGWSAMPNISADACRLRCLNPFHNNCHIGLVGDTDLHRLIRADNQTHQRVGGICIRCNDRTWSDNIFG